MVSRSADRAAFPAGHGDEQLAGLMVLEETHSEVALVSGDGELWFNDGGCRATEQAAAERFADACQLLDRSVPPAGRMDRRLQVSAPVPLCPPAPLVFLVLSGWLRFEPSRRWPRRPVRASRHPQALRMSATVASLGMLTVLEMAPK